MAFRSMFLALFLLTACGGPMTAADCEADYLECFTENREAHSPKTDVDAYKAGRDACIEAAYACYDAIEVEQ